MIHSVASGTEPPDFSFHKSVLIEFANDIVVRVVAVLDLSFHCHAPVMPEETRAFPGSGEGETERERDGH